MTTEGEYDMEMARPCRRLVRLVDRSGDPGRRGGSTAQAGEGAGVDARSGQAPRADGLEADAWVERIRGAGW